MRHSAITVDAGQTQLHQIAGDHQLAAKDIGLCDIADWSRIVLLPGYALSDGRAD
jgi:hypothetical protein